MSSRQGEAAKHSVENVHIVALAIGLIVTDDASVAAWTPEQREQVVRWMSYVQAAASDHIVRRKNLIQPDFSKGVIRDHLGSDDANPEVCAWQDRVNAMFDRALGTEVTP